MGRQVEYADPTGDAGPVTRALEGTVLLPALQSLRTQVEHTALPLDVEGVSATRRTRSELLAQLDDYLIPRAKSLDAPLLAVVGGSTGAGKSTLVNSVVGEHVSRSGVLRPTTLASTLVHNPADERWFAGDRVLPGLARLTGDHTELTDPGTLHLVSSGGLPQGVALLDAPDIDSVVAANRDLARQLMSAADLWIFVTTAARYADAVPWELLHQAIDRGTSVAVVLNRVPTDAMEDVRSHFAGMLAEQGLGQSPVFAIIETGLETAACPTTRSPGCAAGSTRWPPTRRPATSSSAAPSTERWTPSSSGFACCRTASRPRQRARRGCARRSTTGSRPRRPGWTRV